MTAFDTERGRGRTSKVIPRPQSLTDRDGSFTLRPETRVSGDAAFVSTIRTLLGPATGFSFEIGSGLEAAIVLTDEPELPPEGYRLTVCRDRVVVAASSAAGAFYAVQTMRQLLPAEIYRRAPIPGVVWRMQCVEMEDAPRFGWRGGMLDVARHFMPIDFLFRFVDLLAMHKLNVLHLHLTDDQGWRFESKRYPRLTEVGSWRTETAGDGKPHGGFYTQDDLRDLVEYAARRFVTVVPEIEMPGHMTAAIAAYPDLGHSPVSVATEPGIFDAVLNLEEPAVRFCTDILEEVLEVFPGRFVHIGGDECPTTQWEVDQRTPARLRELGLTSVAELQPWFTAELVTFLADRGRSLVGWDEIVDGGPVPGATVMAWRYRDWKGTYAAELGQPLVMCHQDGTYLDVYQGPGDDEPFGQSTGLDEPDAVEVAKAMGMSHLLDAAPAELKQRNAHLPLQVVYERDPVPNGASQDQMLGMQFQLWSEYLPGPRAIEYAAFPRAVAIADIAWSNHEPNYEHFLVRIESHLRRLDALGVNYRPLDGPHPWQRSGNETRRNHEGDAADAD